MHWVHVKTLALLDGKVFVQDQLSGVLYHWFIVMLNQLIFQSTNPALDYSLLKLFTGLASPAFIARKLTVINAINKAATPATANIHQLIFIL